MKSALFKVVSSAIATITLVGCGQVEGEKPKACEPGSSERCPYVNAYDVPTSGKYGTTTAPVQPTPAPQAAGPQASDPIDSGRNY